MTHNSTVTHILRSSRITIFPTQVQPQPPPCPQQHHFLRYNRNHRRVRNNITSFIRTLVFSSDDNVSSAVHRFQQKLSITFAVKLWGLIRKKIGDSNDLPLPSYLQHIRNMRQFFHDYEFEFFGEVFKMLDRKVGDCCLGLLFAG